MPHTLSQMAIQSCTSPPLTSWGGKGRLNAVLQKMSLRSNLPGPAAHLLIWCRDAHWLEAGDSACHRVEPIDHAAGPTSRPEEPKQPKITPPVIASSSSTTPPVRLRDLNIPTPEGFLTQPNEALYG